jgi:hypothetical protein
MTWNRPGQNSDDPKAMTQCERGQYATLGYAEHRFARDLAGTVQTRVAVAGDHKGITVSVASCDQSAERRDHAIHVALRLDAGRAFSQGNALKLRSARNTKRLKGPVDAVGHRLVAVGIDHQNSL